MDTLYPAECTAMEHNPSDPIDKRLRQAQNWVSEVHGHPGVDWRSIAGDASFRRYFRFHEAGQSYVLMDAPPELEDSAPFLDVAKRLREAGLHAPNILACDLGLGFMILEDLGDDLYRDLLKPQTVELLFKPVFAALSTMAHKVCTKGLPVYGPEVLHRELSWFEDYYLAQHLNITWNVDQRASWHAFCDSLVAAAVEQPQVFVHRDVHSCNLLYLGDESPGIIDFQDAVKGPVTYDFVSLIWDRYTPWSRQRLEHWMEAFRKITCPQIAPLTWRRWCDLMGLQRNIKIIGRFAQLQHEHGKSGYIEMVPRFYQYLLDVLPRYPEFEAVERLLGDHSCAP